MITKKRLCGMSLLLIMLVKLSCAYKINFDPSESPPGEEPTLCADMKYSLPINRQSSVPITAYLVYDTGDPITQDDVNGHALFDVESLDVNQVIDEGYIDDWVISGGQLCQAWDQNIFTARLQQQFSLKKCMGRNNLRSFKMAGGVMKVERLMHVHGDAKKLPANPRVYRFTVHLTDGSTISAVSNPFSIHKAVDHLEITSQPVSVRAGEEFSVSVRGVGTDGETLTQGADSCLFTELQVARGDGNATSVQGDHSDTLNRGETIRLRGSAVRMKTGTRDNLVQQQMINGQATFTGIKLLDVTGQHGVNLSITSFLQSYPFSRWPVDYLDLQHDENHYNDMSKSVVLTSPIIVTEQIAYRLVIVTRAKIKTRQGANFPVEGPVIVEVQDSTGQRIYSGLDSALSIDVSVRTGTLSNDASFTTSMGQGTFLGSIVTATDNVVLYFSATSRTTNSTLIGYTTPPFNVIAEVHLGHFIDMYSNMGPYIDNFVHFAEQDINDQSIDLQGFYEKKLIVHSFDTKSDDDETIKQYTSMRETGETDPSQKVRALIGFGSNSLSLVMQPYLTADQIPQLATQEDLYDFRNKAVYPYYSRINWELGAAIHSALLAASSRGWSKIVVIRHIDFEVSKVFYEKARQFGIELSEVLIPKVSPSQYDVEGLFSEEMLRVKAAGTRIVWVFCRAPELWKVIREAVLAHVASADGYQWVTMGDVTWHNQNIDFCNLETSCTDAMRGLHVLAPTYKLDGLRTQIWEHVLNRHLKKKRTLYDGTIHDFRFPGAAAEVALGYDAVLVYAHALSSIIMSGNTVTGPALALAVRKVAVEGLTGRLLLDRYGNRPGYFGLIMTKLQPPTDAIISRYLDLESDTSQTQLEIRAARQPDGDPMYGPVNLYILPNTTHLNRYSFNTTQGMLTLTGEMLPIPPASIVIPGYLQMEGETVAPFYCVSGCGGLQVDGQDINMYQNGECVSMNQCRCHDGFYGNTCDGSSWMFPALTSSILSVDDSECESGICGSLAVIISVPVVVFLLLLILAVFLVCWCRRRKALRDALANLDWRVNWESEVQTGWRAGSLSSEDQTKNNCVTWKGRKCYSQTYPCASLDVDNMALRLEMVRLKQLNHNNLIKFVGACLEWPFVSILTEACPKGSLEDVLALQNMKLGWDFKYSILKDICRGMEYLHRSAIRSHGRLKSSSCLIDSKWTCKISGFGAPSIRYAHQRRALQKTVHTTDSNRDLFWTAPELLSVAHCLDDVQSGTQPGDVYSFAVIMSEVISREYPYCGDMVTLSPEDIVQLVRDKDSRAATRALRKWHESGGDVKRWFRPQIDDSNLPEEYTASRELKFLCVLSWHQDPTKRPSFRQSLEMLIDIHPIRGELIDNLVTMLEKYSSNLETVLADRSKELSQERLKTEQLVADMLPKKVVDDLKRGRTVEPENYECVTLFFSDLVGFADISKASSPIEVIDLLNDLYTSFDAILETHDVYKVETIGDAYMVVSGLPVRNGDLHAGEIATMSLDLMSAMCEFKVQHMPGSVLQLRAGIHSGPCVAGVVGLKVPRYCLFGDTVNVASRMESTSMALRIQVTDSTANILFKLGGYHLNRRGDQDIKGCGKVTTYWLEGKDGFTKPLPSIKDMADAEAKHHPS